MLILGIETSCDETAAAIVKINRNKFSILSNIVSSQIKIHQPYGGVVPELAARNHIKNILPVVNQALTKTRITPQKINKIAVTTRPGLITSLLVGTETAKVLAYTWQKPVISVNHLKAHIYAAWLANQPIKFPLVALVVSGGHTELVLMKNNKSFKNIGQTLDDAAGEAFDKVAQLLNLGYPGGPIISAEADKFSIPNSQFSINLPRAMINSNDYNFSFSGLKTAVLYDFKKRSTKIRRSKEYIQEMCYNFQQAVVDVLLAKTIKAAEKYKAKAVILTGGVAANKLLREQISKSVKNLKIDFLVPEIPLCTDNAAIVATAGYFSQPTPWPKLKVELN